MKLKQVRPADLRCKNCFKELSYLNIFGKWFYNLSITKKYVQCVGSSWINCKCKLQGAIFEVQE